MLKVVKAGFYTTIQDSGRFGYREYGVPVSGAMDSYSFEFANMLLGNRKGDAVLEITMVGGTFQFLKPTLIVVSGATMKLELNNHSIEQNKIIEIKENDILKFKKPTKGFRAYLAIRGGFKSKQVLGSRSQYQPVTEGNKVNSGDLIAYDDYNKDFIEQNAIVKYDDAQLFSNIVEAFPGPEFHRLTAAQKSNLINKPFQVSKYNNRMAYQLIPLVNNKLDTIITSPVMPGTVQLTPNGNLIVLMRDCQTTGGYPRVLQLTERAINTIAQKKVGDSFTIRLKE